jgi:hypothetical protein
MLASRFTVKLKMRLSSGYAALLATPSRAVSFMVYAMDCQVEEGRQRILPPNLTTV